MATKTIIKRTYYDLDGTLSELNSTYDFIYGFLKTHKKIKFISGKLFDYFLQLMFFIPPQYKRKLLINFLFRGLKKSYLETYYEETYKQKFLESLTDLGNHIIERKKEKKKREEKILLTGCTEIPAKKIGELLGFKEIICTEFDYEKDAVKKISKDTYGNLKAEFVKRKKYEKNTYYTDDLKSEIKLKEIMDNIIEAGEPESHREIYIPFGYSLFREIKRFNYPLISSISQLVAGHLFDYLWVPLFCIFIIGKPLSWNIYLLLFASLISFMLVYEFGYILSDNFGAGIENKSLRRSVYNHPLGLTELLRAGIIRIIPAALLIIFSGHTIVFLVSYAITLAVYILHSFSKEKMRIGTFIALRTIKGIVPFLPVLVAVSQDEHIMILFSVFGIASYYALEYGPRKLGKKNYLNISDEKNSGIRFLFFTAFAVFGSIFTEFSLIYFIWLLLFYALNNIIFFIPYHLKKIIVKKIIVEKN